MRTLFAGRSVDVFGLFVVPGLTEIEWMSAAGKFMHTYVGYALALVVLLHVAGALKHHFLDRDKTLVRMLRDTEVDDQRN